MKFKCPKCNVPFDDLGKNNYSDHEIICPRCGNQFVPVDEAIIRKNKVAGNIKDINDIFNNLHDIRKDKQGNIVGGFLNEPASYKIGDNIFPIYDYVYFFKESLREINLYIETEVTIGKYKIYIEEKSRIRLYKNGNIESCFISRKKYRECIELDCYGNKIKFQRLPLEKLFKNDEILRKGLADLIFFENGNIMKGYLFGNSNIDINGETILFSGLTEIKTIDMEEDFDFLGLDISEIIFWKNGMVNKGPILVDNLRIYIDEHKFDTSDHCNGFSLYEYEKVKYTEININEEGKLI